MFSTHRKLRPVDEILSPNTIAEIAYDCCFLAGIDCYIMPDSRLRCAECTRQGKACVNMSWESLD
jgi:hypothetical protein